MAQAYYTLQQAAEILGKAADDLNQMVRRGEIRAFSDGGNWKFRTQDIDEFKKTQDLLGDYDFTTEGESEDEIIFGDSSESDVLLPSDSAAGRALQQDPISKGSGESDVRLVFSDTKDGSDSDVRLVPDFSDEDINLDVPVADVPAEKTPGDSDIRLILEDDLDSAKPAEAFLPTVEIPAERSPVTPPASNSGILPLADVDDDLFADSGDDMVLDAGSTPKAAASVPAAPAGDDFSFDDDELGMGFQLEGGEDLGDLDLRAKTPTLKQGAGDDDSDSDFDLNLDEDIGLAQDVTPGAGDSGINLARPDDSGILLAKASNSGVNLKPGTDTSNSEFDVSLDSDDEIIDSDELPSFKASDTAPRMSKPLEDSSDEISDSDFELAEDDEDESGSDVIALDEDDEEDSSEDFDDEEDEEGYTAASEEVVYAAPQPAPWGGLWVGFLSITTMVFVVVLMMMYEITRNAWSYNEPYTLNATIIQTIYDVGNSMGIMP